MRELRPLGSVWGVLSNEHPYHDRPSGVSAPAGAVYLREGFWFVAPHVSQVSDWIASDDGSPDQGKIMPWRPIKGANLASRVRPSK